MKKYVFKHRVLFKLINNLVKLHLHYLLNTRKPIFIPKYRLSFHSQKLLLQCWCLYVRGFLPEAF